MYTFIEGGDRKTLTTIRELHHQLADTVELALAAKRAIGQSQSHLANAKSSRNKRNLLNYVRANHSALLGFTSLRSSLNNDISLVWEMLKTMSATKDLPPFRGWEPKWHEWETEAYYINMICCFELMQTALRTSMEHRELSGEWPKVDLPTVSALRGPNKWGNANIPAEVRAVKQWMHKAPEFPEWFGARYPHASELLFRCLSETARSYAVIMDARWDRDHMYDYDCFCKDVVQTDIVVETTEPGDRMMVEGLLTHSGWKVEETQRVRGRKAVANWTVTRPVDEPAETLSLENKLNSLNSDASAAA